MSIIRNLINKKTSLSHRKPTALCFFYDGKFDNELAKLGVQLIGPPDLSVYHWPDSIKTDNIKLIAKEEIQNYTYDFVIFNSLIAQREQILSIPRNLHLPGFVVNHEPNNETQYHINQRLNEAKINLIDTTWNTNSENILYGIEDTKAQNKDIDFLITGNFHQKDYGLLFELKKHIPNLKIMGDCPNFAYSEKPKSYEDYKNTLARCKKFIYLPTQGGVSYDLLWAMAGGACVITLKTNVACDILNANNSIICENISQLIQCCRHNNELIYHNKLLDNMKFVKEHFSHDKFVKKWNQVIKFYTQRVYINV